MCGKCGKCGECGDCGTCGELVAKARKAKSYAPEAFGDKFRGKQSSRGLME